MADKESEKVEDKEGESPQSSSEAGTKEGKAEKPKSTIFGLRTTANREDQVMDFVTSNADKKKFAVYSVIRPHGMRGYIFVEAGSRQDAEQAAFNIPYARGILPNEIDYAEIEHMLEMVKVEMNIRKSDIVEIISGPFKREQAKVSRIDKVKEEVVVELLEAAVPIPITVKMDAVKVIRREDGTEEEPEEESVEIPTPEKKAKPVSFAEDDDKEEFVMPPQESENVEEEKPKEKEEPKEEKKPKKIKLGVTTTEDKKEDDTMIDADDIESVDDISDDELDETEDKKEEKKKKEEAEKEEKKEKEEMDDIEDIEDVE